MTMDFNLLTRSGNALQPTPYALAEYPGEGVSHHAITYGNGKIYVAGGFKLGVAMTNEVYSYDIASDVWTKLPNMPEAVRSGALGFYSNRLVHAGGYDQTAGRITNNIQILPISGGQWITSTVKLNPPKFEPVYFTRAAGLNIMGGGSGNNITTSGEIFAMGSNNTATTPTAPHPVGIRKAGCLLVDNRYLYTLGGYNPEVSVTNQFTMLDIVGGVWTTLPNLPTTTSSCTLLKIDRRIIALLNSGTGMTIWTYNIDTATWEFVDVELHGTVQGLIDGVVVDRSIYLVGGYSAALNKRLKLTTRLDF